jgi:hypothetical protein
MFSVDLSTREWDGHVVVSLGGELELVVVPLRRARRPRWPHTIVRSGTPSSGAEHGGPRQPTGGRNVTVSQPHRRADDRQGWPGFAVRCPRHGETRSGHGGPLTRPRG